MGSFFSSEPVDLCDPRWLVRSIARVSLIRYLVHKPILCIITTSYVRSTVWGNTYSVHWHDWGGNVRAVGTTLLSFIFVLSEVMASPRIRLVVLRSWDGVERSITPAPPWNPLSCCPIKMTVPKAAWLRLSAALVRLCRCHGLGESTHAEQGSTSACPPF